MEESTPVEPTLHYLPSEKNIPRDGRIYVNRNLRMDRIEAIGFDMDHTLALYNRETFEHVTHDLALEKLLTWKGYPQETRQIQYNPHFIIRGLVVDKHHGNFLKMNFHNYIAKVFHGTKPLPKEQRRRRYRAPRINLRSDRYQSFDTLFSMPEGSLYAALIDLKEQDPHGPLADYSFTQLFNDVRACVDSVHRDGSLKKVLVADLKRYFVSDPRLRPTLLMLRTMGKRLFLLTNSEHAYTESVMSFLLGRDWKDLFDLVVVEAKKPSFFMEERPAEPIVTEGRGARHPFVFRAGDADFIEEQLGANGDQVLYFGDHTYGDILRSKKSVGWRTAMIVEELADEIHANERLGYPSRELSALVGRSGDLGRDRDRIGMLLSAMRDRRHDPSTNGGAPPGAGEYLLQELERFDAMPQAQQEERIRELDRIQDGLGFLIEQNSARIQQLRSSISREHNPYWGRLFREGNENSRFGRQVREFACIYTSRVSNFLNYSGNAYFISPEERMPHEL